MFSGHTIFITVSSLLLIKYSEVLILKIFVWILVVFNFFVMTTSRSHYLIDIEVGFMLSILLWIIYEYQLKLKTGLFYLLDTFTGYFEEGQAFDERVAAKAVAENIGANNYHINISESDFEASIFDIIFHLDEPRVGSGVFPQYHVSRLVSRHVKVVLTGQMQRNET